MSTHDYTPKEVAKRLKESMRNEGIRQADLAKELGISASTLSGHLDGKKYISPEVASVLADRHGYNIEFLVAGRGRLFGSQERDAVLRMEESVCEDLKEFGYGPSEVCVGDLADGIGRDYFEIETTSPEGVSETGCVYNLVYEPQAQPGMRIRLVMFDSVADMRYEKPFGQLQLPDALNFCDYLHFVLIEDRKMGRMGEMAYRFQNETKRRDDVNLISFRRASDGTIFVDLADELYDDKGMMDFVGRLMNQEAHLGTYAENRAKMQFLFACMSAVYSYHIDKSVDYEGLVGSVTSYMHEYEMGLMDRVSDMFRKNMPGFAEDRTE